MTDQALVQTLETRLLGAWPSLEMEIVDTWVVRFAKGYSKRANSASPLVAGAPLDDAAIDQIVAGFESHRLRPTFRLTGLEAPDVEARLAGRGFVEIEPSYGMIAPLTDIVVEPAVVGEQAVKIEHKATAPWLKELSSAYGGEKANDAVLKEIVGRIRRPAAFATLELDERPAGWGLGVVERGYLGLFDIVVRPELRGLGLGRQVVCALTAWGRKAGATHAYLQVREDNEVARELYRALGFKDAYRYTYRVPPSA